LAAAVPPPNPSQHLFTGGSPEGLDVCKILGSSGAKLILYRFSRLMNGRLTPSKSP